MPSVLFERLCLLLDETAPRSGNLICHRRPGGKSCRRTGISALEGSLKIFINHHNVDPFVRNVCDLSIEGDKRAAEVLCDRLQAFYNATRHVVGALSSVALSPPVAELQGQTVTVNQTALGQRGPDCTSAAGEHAGRHSQCRLGPLRRPLAKRCVGHTAAAVDAD
jgi:hypothetical protein